jgi:hypothetical protein
MEAVGRIRGELAERRRCVAGDCARLLRQVEEHNEQRNSREQHSSISRSINYRRQGSLRAEVAALSAPHCSPAAQPIVAVFRQSGQLPLTPAGVSRSSQASAYRTSLPPAPAALSTTTPSAAAPSLPCASNCSCTARARRHCCLCPPAASAFACVPRAAALLARPPWICLHRRF